MAKKIFFFDAATKTGWAVYLGGEPYSKIESGVVEFRAGRGESNGMRYRNFAAWVGQMLDKYKPSIVGYEQAHHRGGYATELCVNFTGRIQEECARRNIDYAKVHTAKLKKHITGNGRASKVDVIEAVKKKYYGIGIVDDNHADALAGLDYMMSKFI